jgi:predicted nucleic acid-binding Zn ribbon protein
MSTAKTAARGYGWDHQKLRAWWTPHVDAGLVDCWRCGRHITPGTPWDLGHDDHDRTTYRGPEHQQCNRSTAATKGNRRRPSRLVVLPPIPKHRQCEICGATYTTAHREQRTCGRTCGQELRRRNRAPRAPRSRFTTRTTCSECNVLLTDNSAPTCSDDCAEARDIRLARSRYRQDAEYRAAKANASANRYRQDAEYRAATRARTSERHAERRDAIVRQPPTASRW